MQPHPNTLFTPAEAAALTSLPVKAVNNAIDRKTIPLPRARRGGAGGRLLDVNALMSLTLERRLADRLAPALRRQVFAAMASAPRGPLLLDGGLLTIDLRPPRRELAALLRRLRRARAAVDSDPDVMGGVPVFRGTRIPVHLIATLSEQGSSETELLEAYPRLTAEWVRLAPVYARAYPLRGRPRAPARGADCHAASVAAG